MYVLWNLPISPVLSLSKFSSNVQTISAAEAGISTLFDFWRKTLDNNDLNQIVSFSKIT